MTKLSELYASNPITSAVVEANKGSLILHAVKQGSPNESYGALDDKLLTQRWADAAARAAAVPGFIGQLGVQIDTGAIYQSTGTSAGNWANYLYKKYLFYLNTQYDTATSTHDISTMSDIISKGFTGIISVTGRKYKYSLFLPATINTTGGISIYPLGEFFAGTHISSIRTFNSTANTVDCAVVSGTTLYSVTPANSDNAMLVEGTFVGDGALIVPSIAQASTSGTTSILVGATFEIEEIG